MKRGTKPTNREIVPLVGDEYGELIRSLTFLSERDTDLRLYQRLLSALREMGNRATCVQIGFEPHNYRPSKRRRKARSTS